MASRVTLTVCLLKQSSSQRTPLLVVRKCVLYVVNSASSFSSTYPLSPACSPGSGLVSLHLLHLCSLLGFSPQPLASLPPLLLLHLLAAGTVVSGLAHHVNDLLHQRQAVCFSVAADLCRRGAQRLLATLRKQHFPLTSDAVSLHGLPNCRGMMSCS